MISHQCMIANEMRSLIQTTKAIRDVNFYFTGILDDGNALCQACEQSLSSLLMLMDVYRKELDYVIVSRLIDVSMYIFSTVLSLITSISIYSGTIS